MDKEVRWKEGRERRGEKRLEKGKMMKIELSQMEKRPRIRRSIERGGG